jgi:hypothetical protein
MPAAYLDNRVGSLTAHVVDGILVTKPVGTLDSVIHVPPPVILCHVLFSTISENSITEYFEEFYSRRALR